MDSVASSRSGWRSHYVDLIIEQVPSYICLFGDYKLNRVLQVKIRDPKIKETLSIFFGKTPRER